MPIGAGVSRTVAAFLCGAMLLLAACGGSGGGSPTSISITPPSLSFSLTTNGSVATQAVTAQFQGSGVVVGYAPGVAPPPWLSVFQDTSSSSGSRIVFNVTASAQGLPPGNYHTSLRFATGTVPPGGSIDDATHIVFADLPVSLAVINLSLVPSSASFAIPEGATTPSVAAFSLSTDTGTQWTATSNRPWLTVSVPSGTGSANLEARINPVGLTNGSYMGDITISDGKGHSGLFTVDVTVSPPQLTVAPDSLVIAIGSDTSIAARSRTLAISDQLNGQAPARAIAWTLRPIDVQWLSMSPASGSSSPGGQATVTVPSDALSHMANGTYNTALQLDYKTSDSISRTLAVPVTLQLTSPLQRITVTQPTGETAVAQSAPLKFQAIGTYADGYEANLTQQLAWSSTYPDVAAVGTTSPDIGSVQPLKPGTTVITATDTASSIQGSATLPVVAPALVAYVVDSYFDPKILQFVAGDDGLLRPMAQTSVTGGPRPMTLNFTPNGRYAYVINGDPIVPGQYGISQFKVEASGALTPLPAPTVSLGSYPPRALTIDATGQHVYVVACCTQFPSIVRLDIGADGALTLDSRPPVNTGGTDSTAIAANPAAAYLYTPDFSGNTVKQFAIGATGALTALTAAPPATGPYPVSITLDSSGTHAYVANFNESALPGTVSQYDVGPDGTLRPMATPSVTAGQWPWRVLLAPSGDAAYLIYQGGGQYMNPDSAGVATFTVGANGGLTLRYTYTISSVRDAAIDPSGRFLYVSTGFNTVQQYSVGGDGTLTLNSHVLTTSDPTVVVVRSPPPPAP